VNSRPDLPSLEAVATWSTDSLPAALGQLEALRAEVWVRLVQGRATSTTTDRLLTIQEAAARTGMSTHWLYRHARTLPFIRRPSPRAVRVSEGALSRWLATRTR
jgi:predicted DNA-binding transcriptional regulator AlpA